MAKPPVLDQGFTSEETTTIGVSKFWEVYLGRLSSCSDCRCERKSAFSRGSSHVR